jgi:hypothetical protein
MNSIKYRDNRLSEEHIKHIARFAGEKYLKGEYQKWSKFAQFKLWHYNKMMALEKNKKREWVWLM